MALTAALSHPTLYQFLRLADVPLPHDESWYGLALPLGGEEVSLQDIVRLCAALADNGELRPLRWTLDQPWSKGRRIFSAEAAFLTLEMLGTTPRPGVDCIEPSRDAPVYWKTGTSHGFRDAWSIAVFDHYVLGVWIGNFGGKKIRFSPAEPRPRPSCSESSTACAQAGPSRPRRICRPQAGT